MFFGALPQTALPSKVTQKGKKQMGKSLVFIAAAVLAMTSSTMRAQSAPNSSDSERKIVWRVAPKYPELAKKMNVHGTVRIEAVVRPNGSVKSTRVLGGNPVLVDAAVDAVEKWRFAAAQGDTTQVVQIVFETMQ
jgi:TonB family protein